MFLDSLMRKIVKNAGIIFCGNSVASALNLASFALLARALGPDMLAIFVLIQTYSLIINDIFNIQTWETMIKFGASKFDVDAIGNTIKLNLCLDCVSAIVAFLFAFILIDHVSSFMNWGGEHIAVFKIFSLSILFNVTTLSIGIPRLYDSFAFVAKVQVVISFLKLATVSLLYYLHYSLNAFVVVFLIFNILLNVSLIIFSLRLLLLKLGPGWWRVKTVFNRDQMRFVWWSNLRTIIRIPVRHFDVIVISMVLSLPLLGFYKVYKEFSSITSRIGDPVNQAIFPEFSKLIGAGKSEESVIVARKTIGLMLGVSLILTIGLLLVAKPVVSFVFGVDYLEYIYVLYAMIIVSGMGFCLVPIDSLFIAAGFARMSFFLVAVTNFIYLLVAYVGGTYWGLYGVVSANAIQKILNKLLKIFLMVKFPSGWRDIAR